MNTKSYLCHFINEHENWQELLESMNIKIKTEDNLAIFSYTINADFTNPIVQEARGIIVDLNTLDVVCFPFRKFGNWNESYADTIDWSTARVQEKIDGSIVKLYYYNNNWNWATNNTIHAENTIVNNVTHHTFTDIIKKAKNYSNLLFNNLNKNKTYIFEVVSPENQIVVKYTDYMLYHTGTRDNITGQESIENIGIEHPLEYGLSSFEECIEAVKNLNVDEHNVEHEGFVVVDNNWNRIKIKSLSYITLHHLVTNNLSKKAILEYLLTNNDLSALQDYPQYKVYFSYYKYKLDELLYEIDKFMTISKQLYEEYSYDRKAVANIIKKHKYASFGFKALDNPNITAKELFDTLSVNKLDYLIPDYVENDIISELNS